MPANRPLKIGITCHPTVGGSGVLASALGEDLAARGHEIHFISTRSLTPRPRYWRDPCSRRTSSGAW